VPRSWYQLSAVDKHRTVVPVASAVFEADLEAKVKECQRVGVRWFFKGNRFKSGAKFAQVAVVGFDPARSSVGVVGPVRFLPMLPRGSRWSFSSARWTLSVPRSWTGARNGSSACSPGWHPTFTVVAKAVATPLALLSLRNEKAPSPGLSESG